MASINIYNLNTLENAESVLDEVKDENSVFIQGGINWGKIVKGIGMVIEGLMER